MAGIKPLRDINDLVYGRINKEDKTFTEEDNVFTSKFSEYIDHPYPNIEETIKEINEIMLWQNDDKFADKKERYHNPLFVKDCDFNIQSVFEDEFQKMGIPYIKGKRLAMKLEDIQGKLGALVMQLKVFYNRPRAYQVAYYTGQNFNPNATISGNSPAYPSGHSCQSWFMGLVVSSLYPNKKKQVMKLVSDIADTRLVLGVHYPSDQKFGKMIAYDLWDCPKIQKTLFK